jgi:hypothetical protein
LYDVISLLTDTEDFLGDADEDLEAMQSTVYLLQQQLKEAKERISKQLVEIDELRTNAVASQLNGTDANLTLPQHTNNSRTDSAVRTDGIVDAKKEVVNNSFREEQEFLDSSVVSAREKHESTGEGCSKHCVESMDIEADSTTGVTPASCRNHSDHSRTKTSSERLGGSAEDSNGKKAAVERCRTASTKTKVETVECMPNGVAVGHSGKVVD